MTTQKTNRQRCDEAFEANLRVLNLVDFASLHATDGFDSPDRPAEDLLDDLQDESMKLHPSLTAVREAVNKTDKEMGSLDALGDTLYWAGLLGLAVQFATPVMTKTGKASYTFSWGYYSTTWVYADSYEDAWKLGLAWAEQCRKEAKKAPPKRRKAEAAALSAHGVARNDDEAKG